jgi:periplasmic divalent cation tolerance protein
MSSNNFHSLDIADRRMIMIYVFWTCRNKEEAKKIIHGLLEKHLIACASLFPVESVYRWEGKIEEGQEIKVILKTQKEHFDAICSFIEQQGSYDVPEILQIDIMRGNPKYVTWITQET